MTGSVAATADYLLLSRPGAIDQNFDTATQYAPAGLLYLAVAEAVIGIPMMLLGLFMLAKRSSDIRTDGAMIGRAAAPVCLLVANATAVVATLAGRSSRLWWRPLTVTVAISVLLPIVVRLTLQRVRS